MLRKTLRYARLSELQHIIPVKLQHVIFTPCFFFFCTDLNENKQPN